MAALAGKTPVPLWAPAEARLPNPPGGNTSGYSAWVHAFSGTVPSYLVHVGRCTPDPSAILVYGKGQCPGDMASLTSGFAFGGNLFPTPAAAQAAVNGLIGARQEAPGPSVDLGNGVTAQDPLGTPGLLFWRNNGWSFVVDYSAFPEPTRAITLAQRTAGRMVAYINAHPLPSGPGVLVTSGTGGDAGSGATTVYRAVGRSAYVTNNAGYAPLVALWLNIRLRPFPSASAPAAGSNNSAGGAVGTGSGRTGNASTGNVSASGDLTADEAAISAQFGNCTVFTGPAGCQSVMYAVSTPDGHGGTLYAIEMNQTMGDGTGRGSVFFYDGITPLTVCHLPPEVSYCGPGDLQWVAENGVAATGTGQITVQFVVSSHAGECNACIGDAGTDTYVYRENASGGLELASGQLPPPPKVIGG
jgi:hypothetical protein